MALLKYFALILLIPLFFSCKANPGKVKENLAFLADEESPAPGDVVTTSTLGGFNADSAFNYLAKQVSFGPRVPNSEAHRQTGDWLVSELKRHGLKVTEQNAKLKAFDGTILNARNIFGQTNPDKKERILLLAHWDCRPWADQDPDRDKRSLPVDGANDGASGVAVLLEVARQLSVETLNKGIDILFVDAEDWGTDGDEESWALGTKYFVENTPLKNYSPQYAILLDMVGGEGAKFHREYYSERYAPQIADRFWQTAHRMGYGEVFPDKMGSAIMDDHIQLIRAGIPAIDIIEYQSEGEVGFNSRWHTSSDNLDGISKITLSSVGKVLMEFLRN